MRKLFSMAMSKKEIEFDTAFEDAKNKLNAAFAAIRKLQDLSSETSSKSVAEVLMTVSNACDILGEL